MKIFAANQLVKEDSRISYTQGKPIVNNIIKKLQRCILSHRRGQEKFWMDDCMNAGLGAQNLGSVVKRLNSLI